MSFTLPVQHVQFYQEVLERCNGLIRLNYWDRIDNFTFQEWLKNFNNDDEKYLAAQILFHFQYRNKKAMISMVKQIIQVYLPQKLKELDIYHIESISKWENILKTDKAFSLPLRFSTINKDDKIGESGDALFRMIAQSDIVYKDIGKTINSINPSIKTVVLIDDITGSGKQFKKFYNKNKDSFDQFENIIYCPLVAHEDAIDAVTSISPKIHLIPAEIITREHSFFNITDENNKNADFLKFYDDFIAKENLNIKFPYGYSDQGIFYCMNISTPNNNIPLIYHNKKWNPLLKR